MRTVVKVREQYDITLSLRNVINTILGADLMYINDELRIKYPDAFNIAKDIDIKGNFGLQQSLYHNLANRTKFGESKKTAKDRAIQEHRERCAERGDSFNVTDVRLDGIYSHSTFENYLKVGGRFLEYLDREDLNARSIEHAVKRYGVEFLKDMEDRGLSDYSIAQAKSCLGKIIDREIDFKCSKQQEREITKGRSESVRTRTFNEERNKDLVTIARATGGRRGDLEKLRTEDFVRDKGIVVGVDFHGSKGGRDRYSPILREYQGAVTAIVTELERTKQEQVFETVNSHANIHSYRREYAQSLYNTCVEDPGYKQELLKIYESKGYQMSDFDKAREEYKTRDGRVFDRASLFVSSQGLGHNRLDIIPNNYFK